MPFCSLYSLMNFSFAALISSEISSITIVKTPSLTPIFLTSIYCFLHHNVHSQLFHFQNTTFPAETHTIFSSTHSKTIEYITFYLLYIKILFDYLNHPYWACFLITTSYTSLANRASSPRYSICE